MKAMARAAFSGVLKRPKRVLLANFLQSLFRQMRGHLRLEKSGQHDVAANVARAVFLRQRLAEADQSGLGRGVGPSARDCRVCRSAIQ